MTEIEIMKRAKSYIDMLANGVDPISGADIEDDSVLNNVRISRCLFYVSDVLQKVIDNGYRTPSKTVSGLKPFRITAEQAAGITLTEDAIGVTELVKRINAVIDEGTKPLNVTKITGWLLDNGYLTENIYAGKKVKIASPAGEALGIVTVDAINKTGISYKKNVYPYEAQKFIVRNLDNITGEDSQNTGDVHEDASL